MKKAEKTEITVNRILSYAIEEFGKNGYANGKINNICRQGINKGLIYHNFKDKDALYMVCLKKSCERMVAYLHERACTMDFVQYMRARSGFIAEFPNEAFIFFEAVLEPQEHLKPAIEEIMREFEQMNEEVCKNTLKQVKLREGISYEEAIGYFRQMQDMFNAYFNSSAYREIPFEEKLKVHENDIPKLVDYLLYGIAKGDV